MVGLFKRKNPGNAILLFIYALILKFHVFLKPVMPAVSSNDSYLYRQILKVLLSISGNNGFLFSLISFLLLFIQASLFNRIFNHHKLLPKSNYLPGMAFVLITSLFVTWNYFSAPLLVNTLLVWTWYRLLNLFSSNQPGASIFNSGILVGMMTMVYFPAIIYTLLLLFALIILRPFRIREWIVTLIGLTTPYYFLFLLLYLSGKWSWKIIYPGMEFSMPAIPSSIWITIALALLVIPFVIGGFYIQNNLTKLLIQVRKSWSMLLLFLMMSACIIFINVTSDYDNWMLTAIPFAAFHASAYFYPSQKLFPLALHWIMFGFVIILMYTR